MQAKNVKKVKVLIREDDSKKLAMKKDKDKLKNDSNILKDLTSGMSKVRTADLKKKADKWPCKDYKKCDENQHNFT